MKRRRTPFIAALLPMLGALAVPHATAQTADPRIADLAGSGHIRVGLFLPQYVKDPATGEPRSVWVEVARALSDRIGVRLMIVEHPTPPQAIACLKGGECDLMFLPRDARASDVGDFSNPIFRFDYTLLVPAGSSIGNMATADRPDTRIAAVRNHASTVTLVPKLRHARMVYAETPDATFDLLRTGQAEAMASARNTLLAYASRLPGSRVLEDYYGANLNRMVVPKGKAGWLAYVGEFVEDAKTSDLLRKAIERGGTRGVAAAGPGDSD